MLSLNQDHPINEIKLLLSQHVSYQLVDDFTCNKCHTAGNVHRLNEFVNVPTNLLIQLKVCNNDGLKIDYIPISIDKQIMINGEYLDLYAIVYHQGSTLHSGHFFAEIFVNSA